MYKNLDKIDWEALSRNSATFHDLSNNMDKLDWGELSCNPTTNYSHDKIY